MFSQRSGVQNKLCGEKCLDRMVLGRDGEAPELGFIITVLSTNCRMDTRLKEVSVFPVDRLSPASDTGSLKVTPKTFNPLIVLMQAHEIKVQKAFQPSLR